MISVFHVALHHSILKKKDWSLPPFFLAVVALGLNSCGNGSEGDSDADGSDGQEDVSSGGTQGEGSGGQAGVGGTFGNGGSLSNSGGAPNSGGGLGAGGSSAGGTVASGGGGSEQGSGGDTASGGDSSSGGSVGAGGRSAEDCIDTGAADNFSFFLTSWDGIKELSQSNDGFGGDLRYPEGETDGLQGADNICQELATRVCHGHKTWKAYLSASSVDARDRIGTGPWYDYAGALVAEDISSLIASNGSCDDYGNRLASSLCGTLDELGIMHDGTGDIDGNGQGNDDDHDTLTGTDENGTYDGFSCDDWTSTTASGSPRLGHSWPARSGDSWSTVHSAGGCGAGTNFIHAGGAMGSNDVGGGGGYGGFYCFALAQ